MTMTTRTPRVAEIQRETRETRIRLRLDLDGAGAVSARSGVGFLDHMLESFGRHALVDLDVECRGDLHVDDHHSVEDVGICLGLALDRALGDKTGVRRYGHCVLPMDETLVTCAVDLGGRPHFSWNVPFTAQRIGTFDVELVPEFWRAVAFNARMNFHAILHHGANAHHIAEAVFKAAARSIRDAAELDPRAPDQIPSAKGVL